ncbi:MAG: DUF1549 and DUF1553 domain-containing protein [Pirellulales bacterium]|nr:DUF1549 and DUF1553 domain-containing protein [Pirellulales bacterium]
MKRLGWLCRAVAVAGLCVAAWAAGGRGDDLPQAESLPEGASLVRLEAFPDRVDLTHPYAYRQILLSAVLADGQRVDATRMARWEVPSFVTLSATGLVRPVSDGSGELVAELAGQRLSIPVAASGTGQPYAVSFVRDVMPAMSKLGCNAGTCHGAASGKNGFKLSLRGYDPLFDHLALTDDQAGRRFNRAAPDQSLMLLKPSGGVPHVGGVLMRRGEPYYELLRAWIAGGVKLDLDVPRVASIELLPQNPTLALPGSRQQFVVLAHYQDGSVRDVTAEAFLESSQTEKLVVDRHGLATAVRRGEAAILARYEGAYAATPVIIMGDRSGFVWQDVPTHNFIDELVYEKLKAVKILPSGLCSDADFIRRVYLDLTGVPPEPEEVRAFLNDPRETITKRNELIDRLVGGPAFVEHWTNKWADLLQVNRKFLGDEGAWAFRNWIRHAVASNMPYDRFVYSILTASGSTLENPPAAYYKVLRNPGDVMENTTQLFLAVRFNCNKCHDHPFERWTQDQYYHLAAYFAQVGRKADPLFAGRTVGGTNVEAPLPLVEVVYDQAAGEVKHERTGKTAEPAFPYAHAGQVPQEGSRREQLARWITAPENPYFAKSYVNRLWGYLFGVGIIEPLDDIRAGNPPTNPALLDRLTQEFISSGFDVQHMFRLICKSRTYQHSLETNEWNADDELNYSHALARRLPAETLYNAVYRATGARPKLPGVPEGFLATQLPDSDVALPDSFLNLFGKPPRESACECERSSGVMLGQALNLVNGPTIAEAIADPQNRLARLVAEISDDARLVEEVFLAILCRLPTQEEIQASLGVLAEAQADQARTVEELNRFLAEELPQRQARWEQVAAASTWQVLDVTSMTSSGGATITKQQDGSLLLSGNNPAIDTLTLTATADVAGVTGFRLEALADPSLPGGGPGRAGNGNFVLNEFRVVVAPAADPSQAKPVALRNARATFAQDGLSAAAAIDGNNQAFSGWAIAPRMGQSHTITFEAAEPLPAGPLVFTFTLEHNLGNQHTIGRLRLAVTTSAPPLGPEGLPAEIAALLAVPAAERTAEQLQKLVEYYRSLDADYQRLAAQAALVMQNPQGYRLVGIQDLAWALINSPAFLFNR